MTQDDKNELSQRQLMALPVLASISNVDKACETVGISRNCYYEWCRQPLFKSELTKLQNSVVEEAVNELKINCRKAATTLIQLTDRDDSPNTQRAAANDILNHIVKFKEIMEIEERLSALEKKAENK